MTCPSQLPSTPFFAEALSSACAAPVAAKLIVINVASVP